MEKDRSRKDGGVRRGRGRCVWERFARGGKMHNIFAEKKHGKWAKEVLCFWAGGGPMREPLRGR